MTHTGGPWYAVNYSGFWSIQDEPYYTSNDLFNEDSCINAKANAMLATAAPDLLEALEILLAGFKKDVDMYTKEEKIKIAESAIKKATE